MILYAVVFFEYFEDYESLLWEAIVLAGYVSVLWFGDGGNLSRTFPLIV